MRRSLSTFVIALLLVAAGSSTIVSCKEKKKEIEVVPDSPPVVTQDPAPVVISADDSLRTGVTDATKDYPTVKTSINDGVITLTGEIKRPDLRPLLQSLQSLRPKKIDNQLVIK